MRLFHISVVLSITTGRLVSRNHMDGIYQILNFLSGDQLFTHQLPRVCREVEPWMRAQFPQLFPDSPPFAGLLDVLDAEIAACAGNKAAIDRTVASWVERVRMIANLPEQVPVYEMGAGMHTHINPMEELRAMFGDDRVIVPDAPEAKGGGA